MSSSDDDKKPADDLNPPQKGDHVGQAEIYRFLTTYYLHQDKLAWNRVQSLFVVQAAIITGAFKIATHPTPRIDELLGMHKGGLLGIAALAVGMALVWIAWRIIERDWQIRDQYVKQPKRGPEGLLSKLHGQLGIRFTPPAKHWWHRGTVMTYALLLLAFFINAILIVVFWYDPPING